MDKTNKKTEKSKNTNSMLSLDYQRLITGGILILLGILSPLVIRPELFRIVSLIRQAASKGQVLYLMAAALLLVLLNTLRSLPHYIGTYLIIQAITVRTPRLETAKNIIISAIAIPGVYSLIELMFGISYDFAVPAILMISTVITVSRLRLTAVNIFKQTLMIAMFITCIQFLDVFPGLSKTLFGRGELSAEIKTIASYLDAEKGLRIMCIIFMSIFALFAVVLEIQVATENNLRTARKESEKKNKELMEAKLRLLDSRMNQERQFLVHDLKAPLTSIQIWTDLLQMKSASDEGCAACGEYVSHINDSIAHMNLLISEIMNAKTKNIFAVQEVLKLFSSQTSPTPYSKLLRIECDCPKSKVEVNRTNFVRALINLTDNAARAVDKEKGEIVLTVNDLDGEIHFKVSDNGIGISEDMLDKIWEKGVSGRNSTGVGLFFVKEVVTELGGNITMRSTLGEGTEVTLSIPEYINS